MRREASPEEPQRLVAAHSPERLHKNLRRTNLLIPITAIALGLCMASLCIEGYDTLLVALAGVLTIQLIHLATNRREIKRLIKRIEQLTKENE